MAEDEFFTVEGLSMDYSTTKGPVHALDDVSFSIKHGESVGIAGESGCGKTSLGMCIMRMLQNGNVKSGDIRLEKNSILSIKEKQFTKQYRWKEISMVFQGAMNSLDPVFTINQQFRELLRQHGFKGNQDSRISSFLSSVGLDDTVLAKYPHELSGGMKQRIVIAMALLLDPKLIICDEPTTALDVLVQAQIIKLLKEFKKRGKSIILITHDLSILSEISEKIGIMYGGKMVEFASSEEIYKEPKHPYTQSLLESIPRLRGKDIKPQYIRGTPPDLADPPKGCRFYDRCPKAMDKCKRDPPSFPTDTGYTLCWLYE